MCQGNRTRVSNSAKCEHSPAFLKTRGFRPRSAGVHYNKAAAAFDFNFAPFTCSEMGDCWLDNSFQSSTWVFLFCFSKDDCIKLFVSRKTTQSLHFIFRWAISVCFAFRVFDCISSNVFSKMQSFHSSWKIVCLLFARILFDLFIWKIPSAFSLLRWHLYVR